MTFTLSHHTVSTLYKNSRINWECKFSFTDFLKCSCNKLLFLDLRMTNIQTSVMSLLGTVKALIKWNIFSTLKEHEHPEIIFHFQFTLLGTIANPFFWSICQHVTKWFVFVNCTQVSHLIKCSVLKRVSVFLL